VTASRKRWVGKAGTAVKIDEFEPRTWAESASLAGWLIEAPGQSPAWSHYGMSLVHLRPVEGAPDPVIRIPGATHEILLYALDSEANPKPNDRDSMRPLLPLNAECQFRVDSDDDAIDLLEGCVRAIVDGIMPAEPPFPNHGQIAWQNMVTRSAEHLRTGMHASDSGTRN
jgi:hypothetical protein